MSEYKDGGAAFPAPIQGTDGGPVFAAWPGMSLRDWFAGQALAASGIQSCIHSDSDWAARVAYDVADAMLKEREAKR